MATSWASYWESENCDQYCPMNSSLMSQDQSKAAKLVELMNRTGYRFKEEYGERIFGGPPPGWNRPKPPRNAEIFVRKLPRDCYEDELVPVFEKCGIIYEVRLKMEPNGTTRGYGFIMYTTPTQAECAISKLNNYEIRPGRHIEVLHTMNRCLYITAYPPNKTGNEIAEVIQRLTNDVVSIMTCEKYTKGFVEPSQYTLVNYSNHHSAAMAKRRLIYELSILWGCTVIVQWSATP